jgi:hypothetical protein
MRIRHRGRTRFALRRRGGLKAHPRQRQQNIYLTASPKLFQMDASICECQRLRSVIVRSAPGLRSAMGKIRAPLDWP